MASDAVLKEHLQLAQELDDDGESMTDWEITFLDSVLARLIDKKQPLLGGQLAKLKEIRKRRIP